MPEFLSKVGPLIGNIIALYSRTGFSYLMYPDRLYPWDRHLYGTRSRATVSTRHFPHWFAFSAFPVSSEREKNPKRIRWNRFVPRGPWPVLRKQFRSSLRIHSQTTSIRNAAHQREVIRHLFPRHGSVSAGSADIDSNTREMRARVFKVLIARHKVFWRIKL